MPIPVSRTEMTDVTSTTDDFERRSARPDRCTCTVREQVAEDLGETRQVSVEVDRLARKRHRQGMLARPRSVDGPFRWRCSRRRPAAIANGATPSCSDSFSTRRASRRPGAPDARAAAPSSCGLAPPHRGRPAPGESLAGRLRAAPADFSARERAAPETRLSGDSHCAATRRSSSARAMSRATFDAPMTWPIALRTGEMVIERSTSRPSLARRTVSKCSTRSPRRRRSMMERSSSSRSGGMMRPMRWPIASSAV